MFSEDFFKIMLCRSLESKAFKTPNRVDIDYVFLPSPCTMYLIAKYIFKNVRSPYEALQIHNPQYGNLPPLFIF